MSLESCSVRVSASRLSTIHETALFALHSTGLDITDNTVTHCANNGVQIWSSQDGEDGSIVARSRIVKIVARSGGSGQNGNGINIFHANGVRVEGNRITDSAVSGNAASTIQILGNAFQRIGEVALYAEFGFEGAVIANNLVDGAAAAISVTNLNVCGRIAVLHGNLVRNLERREFEQVDKPGEGIAVEADASVIGNIVENAPTAGIVIGWGRYMGDVIVGGNLIRDAGVGISISSDTAAGASLVTGNMISGPCDGAIRATDQGPVHEPNLAREPVATSRQGGRRKNMAV